MARKQKCHPAAFSCKADNHPMPLISFINGLFIFFSRLLNSSPFSVAFSHSFYYFKTCNEICASAAPKGFPPKVDPWSPG